MSASRDSAADELRLALGAQVRRLRHERGLTTRALAAAAGVTPGFISQVEHAQVTPSVATLFRLAGAFGTTMSGLLDGLPAAGVQRVLRLADRKTVEIGPGMRDEMLSLDPTKQLSVVVSALEPGSSTGEELQSHGSAVEFLTVLEGEVTLRLGTATYTLGAGDSLTFPGELTHGVANEGAGPARLIWVTSPASF